MDSVSGLDRNGQEAAWRAASEALKEHAPDMGIIARTAIMQVVVQAAIPAYLAALSPSLKEQEEGN